MRQLFQFTTYRADNPTLAKYDEFETFMNRHVPVEFIERYKLEHHQKSDPEEIIDFTTP